jgi:hypothetical protein
MTTNKQQTAVDFVPYELALELKQLGFHEPCLASYYHAGRRLDICEYINHGEYTVLAPTYSQAFRWFRDKYKLKCCIIPLVCEQGYSDLYESRIHQEKHSISRIGNYKIYEEAELACLKKLIEIVKNGR